jgi:hypothetical protein
VRELVIHSWCDVCGQDGLRTPAASFTVSVRGGTEDSGPREVELCDVHAKEYLEALTLLLFTVGRTPNTPAVAAGRSATRAQVSAPRPAMTVTSVSAGGGYACPECGHGLKSFSSLQTHVKRLHRCNVSSYYGDTCPFCAQAFGRLAQHLNRAHQTPDIVQAFLLAKHEGDKHGVVKALERDWASAARASHG